MEQLDEHLSDKEVYSPPSFIKIGTIFFRYCIILLLSIILYYFIVESSGIINFPVLNQSIFGVFISDIIITLSIDFILILSNYYLQGQLYKLFDQSVLKATLIPILFWGSIIGLFLIANLNLNDRFSDLLIPFIRISTVVTFYSAFCLIIAQYFKHQNKVKYYSSLFIHWLLAISILHYLP